MSNFNQEAYDRAAGRRDLVRTDLEELAQQVDDGEIDEATAAGLRSGYETELAAAEAEIAKLGSPPSVKKTKTAPPVAKASTKRAPSEQGETPKSGLNTRLLVGAGILVAALVVIVISVQNSSEPDQTAAPLDPNFGSSCADLEASMDNHPGNEFRLAVADCYSSEGNAMPAITHYRAVLDADPTDLETSSASFGLGFLNMQIGQMVEATELFKTATETDDLNYDAKYWYGMMLIYEAGQPAEGVSYLKEVLTLPNLEPDTIANIEEAFAVAEGAGGS